MVKNMTIATRTMINSTIRLKTFKSNFRCMKISSTNVDFIPAINNAATVDHRDNSIWVTATDSNVNEINAIKISKWVLYGMICGSSFDIVVSF